MAVECLIFDFDDVLRPADRSTARGRFYRSDACEDVISENKLICCVTNTHTHALNRGTHCTVIKIRMFPMDPVLAGPRPVFCRQI